ncbi:MAG TPA: SRPBCC family protein [Thermoanaerobaculia bacterium]
MAMEEDASTAINVGNMERWLSVIAGSALAAYGLKRRSIPGLVLSACGGALVWRGATGHCLTYELLGVSTATTEQGDQVSVPYGRGIRVEKTVTINSTPEKVYEFWRNFENLPLFMDHLESVDVIDDKRSHWIAKGPANIDAQWEAEIINEIPNELIGWRSVNGSRIDNAGSVHFGATRAGRSTKVRVLLRYDPPAGKIGAAFAKMFGEDPAVQVAEDLKRLKQLIET